MKTYQQIKNYLAAHPTLTDEQVRSNMKRHGVTRRQIAAVRNGLPPDEVGAAPVGAPKAIRVRVLADFRRAHDIPQKIRERLGGLRPSGYVTEEELRQLCEVPVQSWRRHAELPEFAANKFRLDGVTYWAAPDTIRAMKQITGRA